MITEPSPAPPGTLKDNRLPAYSTVFITIATEYQPASVKRYINKHLLTCVPKGTVPMLETVVLDETKLWHLKETDDQTSAGTDFWQPEPCLL